MSTFKELLKVTNKKPLQVFKGQFVSLGEVDWEITETFYRVKCICGSRHKVFFNQPFQYYDTNCPFLGKERVKQLQHQQLSRYYVGREYGNLQVTHIESLKGRVRVIDKRNGQFKIVYLQRLPRTIKRTAPHRDSTRQLQDIINLSKVYGLKYVDLQYLENKLPLKFSKDSVLRKIDETKEISVENLTWKPNLQDYWDRDRQGYRTKILSKINSKCLNTSLRFKSFNTKTKTIKLECSNCRSLVLKKYNTGMVKRGKFSHTCNPKAPSIPKPPKAIQFDIKLWEKKLSVTRYSTYLNNTTPIWFKYEKCEHLQKFTPFQIANGKQCDTCKVQYMQNRVNKTFSDPEIELVVYNSIKVISKFRCTGCNYQWDTTLKRFFKSKGCPNCHPRADCSTKYSEPMWLYYVRVDAPEGVFYKIGITRQSYSSRFKEDRKLITPLKRWRFRRGFNALDQEQRILKHYIVYRYRGNLKPLSHGGNTELFTKDILGLDV